MLWKKKKKEEKKEQFNTDDVKEAGKSVIQLVKEIFHISERKSPISEYYIKEDYSTKKHSKYTTTEKVVFGALFATAANILVLGIAYFFAYSNLNPKVLTNSFLYIIPAAIFPFYAWAKGTDENFWAFHARKRLFFVICTLNAVMLLFQPLYSFIRNISIKAAFRIEQDEVTRYGKLLLLAYIMTYAVSFIIIRLGYTAFEPIINSPNIRRNIELFKLSHIVEEREDSEYKYDITIIKNLDDGKPIALKENDRFVQTEINGPSGTGKTSSIFITAIEEDMNTKIKNMQKRQEEYFELIRQKKATIKGPIREFREDCIIPIGKTDKIREKNQKEIDKIKKKYPDCGMTIVAPNASLITEIVRLGEARGIKVNILDPIYTYSDKYSNAKDISINPFYIPLGLSENERLIRISEAATVFAEVLIATNQQSGEGDQYFIDISLSVSSNISSVVMLANNIQGKQTYIEEVQNCISKFENLQKYVDIIENHYNINVNASTPTAKGKSTADSLFSKETKSEKRDAKSNPYYQQILFVKQELLGPGGEDMFSQARGLRNLTNKILQDPRIRTRLSAAPEDRIDFDGILANNEITVVNTAIELTKNTSTAFGLFFILLHKTSVLRRPVATRTPHFLWIDEATQYMHPCYEDMISLYRQYRCAVVITLQSLSQTQRNKSTAFLKEVFLGAGTHIVFGRLTPDEMKLYAEMAGISREMEEQISENQSSILNKDTSFTESVRKTPTVKNTMEGADLRILDFQELTVFTIDNGRVLPGQLARVFFVTEDAFDKKKIRQLDWKKIVPEAFHIEQNTDDSDSESEEEVFLFADEEDDFEETSIPEQEVRTVVQKDYEPSAKLETTDVNNMSLDDMFAMLDGKKDTPAGKTTIPDAKNTENPKEKQSDKEDLSDEELRRKMEEFNSL